MGVYVVTGAASGMGRAAAQKLRERGHTVVGVDLRDVQVVADLSTPAGRRTAIDGVLAQVDGHLDGAILAAGVGPAPGADRPRVIFEVNYRGVVDLLDGWRSALARADEAKVVVFGSNSTTTTPLVPRRAIRALLAGDTEKALRALRIFGRNAPSIAYGTSKIAVSHWVRRQATTAQWAGAGIRLNALAPGAVLTPLLEKQLATAAEAKNIERFPVPIGGFGDPGDLAEWAVFMLSPAARFLCGSIVFVDGGSDAYFRAGDWPRAVPLRKLPGYLWRFFGSGPR